MALHVVDDSFDNAVLSGASCAFGVFDGMHVGHKYLIDEAISTPCPANRSVVITFDIDPDEVFHPQRLKKLMRNAERIESLANSGADDVVVLSFTPSLYSLEPDEFLAFMFDGATPAALHVGEDFRFGAKASGTIDTLKAWGARVGCNVCGHVLVSDEGVPITATRIRLLLAEGDVKEAKRLLGHPYRICETVHKGRGDGASFGFATANLELKPHDQVLGEGVYAAYASIDGVRRKAAVSVGVSPTFETGSTANVEAHVLDFEGDLVGKTIALDFVEYLRPMMKFNSTEELIETVMGNIEWVRANL